MVLRSLEVSSKDSDSDSLLPHSHDRENSHLENTGEMEKETSLSSIMNSSIQKGEKKKVRQETDQESSMKKVLKDYLDELTTKKSCLDYGREYQAKHSGLDKKPLVSMME